ncbi:nicotine blue oxidoreductase [Arthrobacter sp. H14-L1]|uniref:nicotine blue oxidoreductase n=1 Tax=Arthrobacter sp. H14-L1 TaxID=2996697 RepID=UPI002271A362|nr:nucleotidyltransferase family protein [Arthrobacter sp. H14-L1]MCY0904993.1 nucleotidyltransferase family protein [Arthrobacter sp. H14-L1]
MRIDKMTTAVLLAAGAGRRLGRGPKALLQFRGTTLVEHLAGVLRAGGCEDIVVVLGSEAPRVSAETQLERYRVLDNPGWDAGMSTSFRLGVGAAAAGNHVLVALVDQPGLTAATVARLLDSHQTGRVTAAGYQRAGILHRGHPVLFDSSLVRQAATVASGDSGARAFLRANPALVDLIDCSDLSDGADVDTPAGLHLLR